MMKKKVSLDEGIIKGSPLEPIISKCKSIGDEWSSAYKMVTGCFIRKIDGLGFILDPFLLRKGLVGLRNKSNVMSLLGDEAIIEIEKWADLECENVRNGFEEKLVELCKIKNIKLAGHFPRYVLEGILNMEIDAKLNVCSIGDTELTTLLIDAIAPVIEKLLLLEAKREFDPNRFLEEMYTAYVKAGVLLNVPIGEAVPIKKVFAELIFIHQTDRFKKKPIKGNFEEYSEGMFARDLGKLLKAGIYTTSSDFQLEFAPTSFSKEGIPVLEPASGGIRYFGRVKFSKRG